MQVPFRFVRWKNPSPESLNGIRVLCLTGCEVLPEAWVDVLKGFVEKGGVVLADLPPGLYDDHGNPRKENRFDQLFGIKNNGNISQMSPWYSAGFTELTKATNFPMHIGTWYPVSVYAPDTEVTDGIILGVNYVPDKKPAFVYKEHGSGMTLVANFLFDGYASNPHQYYRDLMDALLKRSGCELSSAAYNPDDGSILQRRFVNRFSTAKGQIEHLTIAGAKEYPDKIRIAFKRQGHLYDVREKRYLGYTNETLIAGTDHKIISSLPYRIEKLDIICPRAVKRGEDIEVTMVLSGSASECFDHVVRLEVFDPEGCIVPQYCMNVVAKKGKATIRIPLAFNDKKGPWTVKTREVISSIENKKGFEVE